MKKLILAFIVSVSFIGFGVSSVSASVIQDGVVLAMSDKCGGDTKCGSDKKKRAITGSCGDGKCGGDTKCGGDKKDKRAISGSCGDGKCGADTKKPKRPISGSCGDGKCGS